MADDRSSTEEADAPPSGGVDAVDRALAILASFDAEHDRQTLASLAARTGFYKSTILRLARSLEIAGFLHREEGGTFVIGAEPLRLASIFRSAATLESRVRPVLRALRDATGESASFFRREGNRRQCLYREDTHRAVRDHLPEGDMLPLNVGAGGRVLTVFGGAALSEAERLGRAAELPFTCFGERDAEIATLAMPVFSDEGLAGALTLSGPIARLTRERAAEVAPMLWELADELSKQLGGAQLKP